MGIDHKGFVSEEEKINLYLKTKVFIFPSSREGFGMAVAEAINAGIPVVAWDLEVFKELYSHDDDMVKLIDFGNYESFAQKSVEFLKGNIYQNSTETKRVLNFYKWNNIAENVINAINIMENSQTKVTIK